MKQPDSIIKLINKFSSLPGVGLKTAQRFAYSVIDMTEAEVNDFCEAMQAVKTNVHLCTECGNFTERDVCDICLKRDKSVICVVAYPKDVLALDKGGSYKGVYHVLHGTLSPLDGRGADDLNIKSLIKRLEGVKEVIMATNPDVEGEATAAYLARLIKPFGIKVTRLAQGISIGSDIEYADEITLERALDGRTEI
ncbi:MAG: recombination protein RecR [Clostridiales bacterium]|nr:recombination protein RecR [Clostridiales bacterium]